VADDHRGRGLQAHVLSTMKPSQHLLARGPRRKPLEFGEQQRIQALAGAPGWPRVSMATSVLDRCFPVHDYGNPRRRRVIIGARDDNEALAVGHHVKRKIGTVDAVDAVFDLEQRLD
jgi:hypothetical protein